MTDSNYTHILTIVDRSGSMSRIAEDMKGGLNEFFAAQAAEPGKAFVDYVQFDTKIDLVFEDTPASEAKAVLAPRGGTALLDAVGQSVTTLGEKFASEASHKRPGKVIVAVITDGYENASHEWTADRVKDLIKQQEDEYGWEFTFLGANMDAVAVGAGMGFGAHNSMTYDVANTGATIQAMSSNVSRTRAGGAAGYTDDERAKSVGR